MKLWIVGDSFSTVEPDGRDRGLTWPWLVAQGLGLSPDNIVNGSEYGSSLEWAWWTLSRWQQDIAPEDYLVIALTHPGRRWYVEPKPCLGKPEFVASSYPDQPLAQAAQLFQEYLQRPNLDWLHQEMQLGWLCDQVARRGWRRPCMLQGFNIPLPYIDNWTAINISQGCLTESVSNQEVAINCNWRQYNNFMAGLDPRFNHLCLSNHRIMADKIIESLQTDTAVDLTNGFKLGILTEGINDDGFIARELDPVAYKRRLTDLASAKLSMSGLIAGKITSIFDGLN